jgi:hypothetical protein
VQRSIFVNEVLTAGNEAINRIDAVIKNDTNALLEADSDEIANQDIDMDEVVSVQQTRMFLIDSVNNQPIGVIRSTIYFQEQFAGHRQRHRILHRSLPATLSAIQ